MSQISTHVLDTSVGRPAPGVAVELSQNDQVVASGVTDADGRLMELGPDRLEAGTYRLHFATGEYFRRSGHDTFYPSVAIDFSVGDPEEHFHVPLLISPFGFSTYRGS
jgi:5-hydroxyisourate hydrolase